MLAVLLSALFTIGCGYVLYTKFIGDKLDSPKNNPEVKGLEKSELKDKIKDFKASKKDLEKDIKDLEKERKELLKGDESDKGEKAKEKLEEKEEKQKELTKLEADLKDLEVAEKGGWKTMMPNKLSLNNGLYIGGLLIGMVVLYKIFVNILFSLLRSTGLEQ